MAQSAPLELPGVHMQDVTLYWEASFGGQYHDNELASLHLCLMLTIRHMLTRSNFDADEAIRNVLDTHGFSLRVVHVALAHLYNLGYQLPPPPPLPNLSGQLDFPIISLHKVDLELWTQHQRGRQQPPRDGRVVIDLQSRLLAVAVINELLSYPSPTGELVVNYPYPQMLSGALTPVVIRLLGLGWAVDAAPESLRIKPAPWQPR